MRRAIRQPLAVAFGLLLVTAGALGSVTFVNDDVQTLDDASNQFVQTGAADGGFFGTAELYAAAAKAAYEKFISNSPDTDELESLDAQEKHAAIYDQASIQKQNNDLIQTSFSNYLNDTQSIALMEGKNAYIRALENGSAESVARNRAAEAVADYYAVKQQNLIASWNTSAVVINSTRAAVENESELANTTVGIDYTVSGSGAGDASEYRGLQNTTLTAVNASTMDVAGLRIHAEADNDGGNGLDEKKTVTVDPTTGTISETISGTNIDTTTVTIENMRVAPPTDNLDELRLVFFDRYQSKWSQIEAQNDEVQSLLDGFINNTYDSYQQGEINESDLVDPYLGARDYDPETSNTWALRTLTSMGIDPPENLSNIGRMNVSTGGNTYTGTLMSDGKPAGGYAVGGTYNASNITGLQFIATDDGDTVELQGTFTLDSVETADGEQLAENETVEYTTINYQTANTSEFKALQQQLDALTAEINAKQQRERNSGGTGWLPDFGGLGGVGGIGAGVAVAAAAAVVLLGRS